MISVLEEAQQIIHGERNATYGHPRDQFSLVARLWSDYLGVEVTPDDHAAMMVLLKLSRVKAGGYHRDAAVDIAGYAGTMERLREPFEAPEGVTFTASSREQWVVDGRRYWANWADIPRDTAINSSDETDDMYPWHASGGQCGVGPWREWIDPDEVGPRTWDSLLDVPRGVIVTDKDDDKWKRFATGAKMFSSYDNTWGSMVLNRDLTENDCFAPFTEEVK